MRRKPKPNKNRAERGPRFHWAIWVAAAFVAIACVVAIAVAIKSPFTQERVAQGLGNTVGAKVSFGNFHMVYFPNPGCVAEDVTFAEAADTGEAPPAVTIQKLEIEARYADLIVRPGYIARVVLNGLRVRAPLQGISTNSSASQSSQGPEVRIGEIVADGAELELSLIHI